ncbi:MAG: MlaD family protein [Chthoniobacterales bacterium]
MKKPGDSAIALVVVACSLVLFLALAFALNGNPFDRPSRTLKAQMTDITGVQASSLVKYAGATAGHILAVRMLAPDERSASTNPANAIEITIALNNNVPPLNEGLTASVASDTLLSDKFLLLSGGDPKAPVLQNGALIAAIPPATFDAILRDLAGALAKFKQIFGGASGSIDGLLPKVDKILTDLDGTVAKADALIAGGNGLITNANTLVDNGDGLVTNADQFIADGRSLIDTNKDAINRMIKQLSTAADSLDQLATRAEALLKKNEGNINSSLADAQVALKELKGVAISTRALVDGLRARPQSLIWGPGRTPKPSN